MTINRALLALPAALLLAACGGSDKATGPGEGPGPGNQGAFSGNVAGAITKSVTGTAAFGTSIAEGGFALVLGTENDGFIFGREFAGIPAAGTYPVWDLVNDDEGELPENAIYGVFGLTVNGADQICHTSGGTITITSASNTRLKGNVNVTASCYSGASETPTAITLTGQFDAVGAQVD